MNRPMPQLLSLAPRGVIVDQGGTYQGLAPWFEPALLREMLRRYNEYQPLADFTLAWATMGPETAASGEDARREAVLALSMARSLADLVEAGDADRPHRTRAAQTRRRRADHGDGPTPDPDAEPSGPN